MKTERTRFGEVHTSWESHIHPDNQDYQQLVFWHVWEKPDGRVTVAYNLGAGSKSVFIYGLSKIEAIAKYSDAPDSNEDLESLLQKRTKA